MKLLKDLLYNLPIETLRGSTNFSISNIVFDSNNCKDNSLFVAIKGYSKDGHKFINNAILNGSIAIICEHFPLEQAPNVTYIKVSDSFVDKPKKDFLNAILDKISMIREINE